MATAANIKWVEEMKGKVWENKQGGKLFVIGLRGKDNHGNQLFAVQCSKCTTVKEVRKDKLRSIALVSCSCGGKQTSEQYLESMRKVAWENKRGGSLSVIGLGDKTKSGAQLFNVQCCKCNVIKSATKIKIIRNGVGCACVKLKEVSQESIKWANDYGSWTNKQGGELSIVAPSGRDKNGNQLFTVHCKYCKRSIDSQKINILNNNIGCDCFFLDLENSRDDFIGTKFDTPKGGTLRILPWKGDRRGGAKIYPMHCSICSKDTELFPGGSITGEKSELESGRSPCGCSSSKKWREEQWAILVKRRCVEKGYTFKGWAGVFRGAKTKLSLECKEHGVWSTSTINGFINNTNGCPQCANEENSWGYYKKRAEEDDTLYLLRFTSEFETFIKIGRSFNLENRIRQFELKGYEIEVINANQATHKEIYDQEQSIHKALRHVGEQYTPLIKFGGAGECFKPSALRYLL